MWKNFFFFSGSQRAGIILLLFLILLVLTFRFVWLERVNNNFAFESDSAFLQEFEDFKQSLVSIDSLRKAERENRFKRASQASIAAAELFPFNPNELDSAGFVRLGLSQRIASNILKYRSRGGRFRDAEGFSRVYGISEAKYAVLKPYIIIPAEKKLPAETDSIPLGTDKSQLELHFWVELNTADTTELMRIKGVGRYIASGIVHYRNQLGGFLKTDQLLEVRGITPENFDAISSFCKVNESLIRKIRINTASVDRLRTHPYLNFYQARQIYELRRKKGKLQNIDELSKLSELDNITIEKIKVYFSFD